MLYVVGKLFSKVDHVIQMRSNRLPIDCCMVNLLKVTIQSAV